MPLSSTQSAAPSATSSAATASSSSKDNTGLIAGCVVAGVALLVLFIATLIWWSRRRRGPIQDSPRLAPAPYYADPSQTHLGEKAAGSQTVLSPTSPALPEQTYNDSYTSPPSEPAPFDPYGAHSSGSRAQSRTQLSSPPVTQYAPPPAPGQAQQPVDVDRIIELIAQRIDRPPPSESETLPRYPY